MYSPKLFIILDFNIFQFLEMFCGSFRLWYYITQDAAPFSPDGGQRLAHSRDPHIFMIFKEGI